jgi:hypothetical protein
MKPELDGMPITPDDEVPEPLVVPVGLTGSDEVMVVVEEPAGVLPGATAGACWSLPVTPDRLAASPAASTMAAPAGRLTPVIASLETALFPALIVVLNVSVLVPEPPMKMAVPPSLRLSVGTPETDIVSFRLTAIVTVVPAVAVPVPEVTAIFETLLDAVPRMPGTTDPDVRLSLPTKATLLAPVDEKNPRWAPVLSR